MKSKDVKKLLKVVDQIHQAETWQDLGAICPSILDDLIGADFSCWNVFNQQGLLIEVEGIKGYESGTMSLLDPLNAFMAQHPVIANTKISTGEVVAGSYRMTDFQSQKKFEKTGLYQEAYRHLDARYQLGTQVFVSGGIEVTVAVSRRLIPFTQSLYRNGFNL